MEKKQYENLFVEIEQFTVGDIITASPTTEDGADNDVEAWA